MANSTSNGNKVKWYNKLKWKYRLVIMHDQTLEERLTFRLTRLNVFIAIGTISIILIFLTSMLIAFTSLREYIPGYTDVGLRKELYELQLKTDSIDKELVRKDLFIRNLKRIISGEELHDDRAMPEGTNMQYNDITISRSSEDSLLRAEVESQSQYSLFLTESSGQFAHRTQTLGNVLFFTPIKGMITNRFDPDQQHFGIDIVSKRDEAIKSVLDGTVIFSTWTVETGYVIGIQHPQAIVSVYKHNSALLKRVGDIIKAGEAIAIIGETGELSTGPHLHFELWNQGNPVDPTDYISF
ncbi:MAG: M23 family metallopeptidase [Bacteroidales bacterium]|nr:M23 family metallopeptidase [Bacteroidota bacterium]MBL6949741.1 M23 family metallopeptidase [Bacteroidales bacterium]